MTSDDRIMSLTLDAYLACEQLTASFTEGFAAGDINLAEVDVRIHDLMDMLWERMPLAARVVLNRPERRPGEKPALPATLREAIHEIATLTFPAPFVAATPFPELVRALAVQVFTAARADDWAARNIRRACQLLEDTGSVGAADPAVE